MIFDSVVKNEMWLGEMLDVFGLSNEDFDITDGKDLNGHIVDYFPKKIRWKLTSLLILIDATVGQTEKFWKTIAEKIYKGRISFTLLPNNDYESVE